MWVGETVVTFIPLIFQDTTLKYKLLILKQVHLLYCFLHIEILVLSFSFDHPLSIGEYFLESCEHQLFLNLFLA